MNIFLRQEIDRIKRVIGIVRKTLCDLKLAIDGTIVMSQGLRESLDAMYDARIPQRWQKVCGNNQKKKKNAMTDITTFFTLHIRYERVKLESVIAKARDGYAKALPPYRYGIKKKKRVKITRTPIGSFSRMCFVLSVIKINRKNSAP